MMNRSSALRALCIWLAVTLVGLLIAVNSRFSADMSFFLPSQPTAEQAVLVEQLKTGAVSRLLMLAITGGNAPRRAAVSREMYRRLVDSGQFVSVQNGDSQRLDGDRELLVAHRYQLSPAITPQRFSVDGLHEALANSIDLLGSPAGMLFKPLFTRDPTGEVVELLTGLGSARQPPSSEGVWASRDGERAMMIVQTRADGADTDGQEAAIAALRQAFADSRQAIGAVAEMDAGADELGLILSGPGHFAVEARRQIKHEVFTLSLLSGTLILTILALIYRSPRLIGLTLLPIISGMVAGVAAVGLTYDTVFGITVGFGAALIGEAVDYSTYYFMQAGRMGLSNWRQRLWPTIHLGVTTSICGFGALLFSGFPGLAQLGLYSLAGITAAALVTRYILPHLAGDLPLIGIPARLDQGIDRAISVLQSLRWPVLAVAIATAVWLFGERERLWYPDLSAMSTVSAAEADIDTDLRADLYAPDSRYLVVVTGKDHEAALEAAERAGRALDKLVAAGVIAGYDSPARFLPSLATQAARRAALPDAERLRQRLDAALAGLPLSANRLEPFIADIAAAREATPLHREALAGSNLALAVDTLMLQRSEGWSVLLPLHPAEQHDFLIPTAEVRAALAGSDGLFIDMKGEFDTLYSTYLSEAIVLSLAGVGGILLMLAWSLRSPRRLATVMLPLAIAIIFVIAGLHLLGERLHLLHLVGMLLIVAVGSNYTLFLDRSSPIEPEVRASTLLATLTTAIGFGTLGLSSVPVLNAIGLTVGPGAILSLLLAAMFAPHPPRT